MRTDIIPANKVLEKARARASQDIINVLEQDWYINQKSLYIKAVLDLWDLDWYNSHKSIFNH